MPDLLVLSCLVIFCLIQCGKPLPDLNDKEFELLLCASANWRIWKLHSKGGVMYELPTSMLQTKVIFYMLHIYDLYFIQTTQNCSARKLEVGLITC